MPDALLPFGGSVQWIVHRGILTGWSVYDPQGTLTSETLQRMLPSPRSIDRSRMQDLTHLISNELYWINITENVYFDGNSLETGWSLIEWPEAAAAGQPVLDYAWMREELSLNEEKGLQGLQHVQRYYPDIARTVVAFPWVADGLQDDEWRALEALNRTSDRNAPLVQAIVELPWFADGVDDTERTVFAILTIHEQDPFLGSRLIALPMITDGITQQDADTINSIRIVVNEGLTQARRQGISLVLDNELGLQIPPRPYEGFFIVETLGEFQEQHPSLAQGFFQAFTFADGLVDGSDGEAAWPFLSIAQRDESLARLIVSQPWLADASTPRTIRFGTLRDIDRIAQDDVTMARRILESSWVADGLTLWEHDVISSMRALQREDPSIARRISGLTWFADDIKRQERRFIATVTDFLRSLDLGAGEPAPVYLLDLPSLSGDFRYSDYAFLLSVNRIQGLDRRGYSRWEAVSGTQRYREGLAAEERVLLAGMRSFNTESTAWRFRNRPDSPVWYTVRDPEFTEQFENGEIRSESRRLGSKRVDLFQVRWPSSVAFDNTAFETMWTGIRIIEDFMGAEWPVNDVIWVLFGTDHIFTNTAEASGLHEVTHILAKSTDSELIYHELAHYYFHDRFPTWLREGAANFLTSFTRSATGEESLEDRLEFVQERIALLCTPHGLSRIHDFNLLEAQDRAPRNRQAVCPYYLGEAFLLTLHDALGGREVSSFLRALFEEDQIRFIQDWNEFEISETMLASISAGKRERFKDVYRRLHGGPLVEDLTQHPDDLAVLTAVHNATGGETWENGDNWLSDKPFLEWYGVTLDLEGRVSGIDLRGNNLTGHLPPELAGLHHLQRLDLGNNNLTGTIPREYGGFNTLTTLILYENQLTGSIPRELGSLKELQHLDIAYNGLTGEIPAELGTLDELRVIRVYENELTGLIPASLAKLRFLQSLELQSNQLSGALPGEFADWSGAGFLNIFLQDNQLTGCLSPSLTPAGVYIEGQPPC